MPHKKCYKMYSKNALRKSVFMYYNGMKQINGILISQLKKITVYVHMRHKESIK